MRAPGTDHVRRRIALVAALSVAALLSSCTSDAASPASTSRGDTSLTVGGSRSSELLVMQAMYGQLLEKAGYDVDYKVAESREVYAAALESGELDVVPEYAATAAEFWNQETNGAAAVAVATTDATTTVTAMRPLLAARGLSVLAPSRAVDQNGFVVTKAFAEASRVSTLSQLSALGKPIVLAATPECGQRPFCRIGLEDVYGLRISRVEPLGFGTPETKQAVISGQAGLGLVGTTDGTLAGLDLVLLNDDKHLQLADNVLPVVNTASAGTPRVAASLDPLARVLTTGDLAALVGQVDVQRRQPTAVARAYLVSRKLL